MKKNEPVNKNNGKLNFNQQAIDQMNLFINT